MAAPGDTEFPSLGSEPPRNTAREEERGLLVAPSAQNEARLHPVTFDYESANLDASENSVGRLEAAYQSGISRYLHYSARWGRVVLVAIATAILALAVQEGATYAKRLALLTDELTANEEGFTDDTAVSAIAYVLVSIALAAVAALITMFLDPNCRSSVTDTMCYLNGIIVNESMRLKTLVATVLGVVLSTCTLAVGKEGPMMVIGAQVGTAFAQMGGRGKLSEDEQRNFASIGLASGIACAFGAPAGAVLFALEKTFHFTHGLLTRIFVASMLSCFILSVLLTGIDLHQWGQFLPTSLAQFGIFTRYEFGLIHTAMFVLMGVIGGIVGALYVFLNMLAIRFRRRFLRTPLRRCLEVIVLATLTAVLSVLIGFIFRECTAVPTSEGADGAVNALQRQTMFCGAGQYNPTATLFMNLQSPAIRFVFHAPEDLSSASLVLFVPTFFLLSVVSVGSAVPSGFFLPSLLIGAATGRLIAQGLVAVGYAVQPSLLSLLGAAAVLGGVSRMTVSLCVILCEATDQTAYMLPLMITLLIARWVGDIFTPSITDTHIRIRDYPVLAWSAPSSLSKFTAEQVMSRPPAVLRRIDTLEHINDALTRTRHNGFPVVEPPAAVSDDGYGGTLLGIVRRDQLVRIMNGARKQGIRMDERADLSPHALHALTVPPTLSCTRVFNIFRALGLRHIVVTDQRNAPVGVITRKDLFFLHESVLRNEHRLQRASICDRLTAALYGHTVHYH